MKYLKNAIMKNSVPVTALRFRFYRERIAFLLNTDILLFSTLAESFIGNERFDFRRILKVILLSLARGEGGWKNRSFRRLFKIA